MKTTEIKTRSLIQKYLDIIKTTKIEENELIGLISIINGGRGKASDDEKSLLKEALNEGDLTLSPAQNAKGYAWLMDQWKTPSGKKRLNNPFGYREQAILENFSHFEVRSLYNAGNASRSFYVPLYECCGNNNSFEYYVSAGEIHIVG